MNTPDEIGPWRRARRQELLARRTAVALPARRAWDAAITRLLTEGFPQLGQMTVGFYWPFKSEFDPRFAIRHWRQRGATAALPLVTAKSAPLQFRQWWPGAWATGFGDLPFPDGTTVVTPQALLIPPVGSRRLGYRPATAAGISTAHWRDDAAAAKIGVAYELSRMPTITRRP
jgi:5,10-methenyltetrahydrofolate synthetase